MSADLALFAPLLEAPHFRELEQRVRGGGGSVALEGLVGGAGALVLTLLAETTGRRVLIVVPDDAALEARHRDLAVFAAIVGRDPRRVVVMPAMDADPYNAIPAHPEIVRERVVALGRLARGEADFLIAPARALLSRLPSPEELGNRTRAVRKGDALPPDRFVLEAMGSGYRRVDVVSAPGEVSRRGGIVDIFPPSADEPIRIELFGDTVDSLRSFDTDHQRSTGFLEDAVIAPAAESSAGDEALERLARYLEDGASRARKEDGPVREFREKLDELRAEGYLPGLEALATLTAARPVLLFDHAREMLLAVDEPERVEEELARAAHDARSAHEQSGDRILPSPERLYAGAVEVRDRLRSAGLFLQELAGAPTPGASVSLLATARPAPAYSGRIADLSRDLEAGRAAGARTLCVMRAPGSAARLAEVLAEYGQRPAVMTGQERRPADAWGPGGVFVLTGALRSGFEFPQERLLVLSEREVFGEEPKAAERKSRGRAAFVSDFRDLKVGSTVVHVDHGLARYAGLGRPKGGSLNRDFMVLEFALGDRLFVPVDRLDLVQKYSGVGGHKPHLDRLGGPGWEKIKSRVRKSVESMAKELLDLYARRRTAEGNAFSPDTPWQREIEEAFPYELTPDQERAIEEVKRDMESKQPMDRLLVGDVGYGKTEVAVRAAFKAVMDGFQVAMLAPTTVLAAQHFSTFRKRIAPFPVRVEMVSRFRSPADIKDVLVKLERGEVDVLIGTHRLLSRDVRFHKLGLLVVDEEQRFGVAHKERIKKLAVGIDVLAMTATPIPRTLQMSLAGVRDLSIIETPPPGRSAIQTYLVPFRKSVIAQAIRQELRRNGQVFVVHDRVETLPAVARAVRELVPEARLVTAHGQLPERELERVMLRFVNREADVLVTTSIIENGLDIPSANTIVVNRADRFGLAQLYQLRGRVGRSEQHAYAYFIIPGRHALSDTARRRLKALQEFSELGAGFRLAAADLEIRGAGEFLGSKQHGHIASLGFDLYAQLLEQAVRELQGEKIEERAPVSLHLGVDIKVPESYMPEVGDRLVLYKKLASARDGADVDRLQAETEDRYGHLPPSGINLFDMGRLRVAAEAAGVRAVDVADGKLQVRFQEKPRVEPRRVIEMLARERGTLTPSGMMLLPAPDRAGDRIRTVRELLDRLASETAA